MSEDERQKNNQNRYSHERPNYIKPCLEEWLGLRQSRREMLKTLGWAIMDLRLLGLDAETVFERLSPRLQNMMEKTPLPGDYKQLKALITWHFKKKEIWPLGCAGVLVEEMVCFKDKRPCPYDQEQQAMKASKRFRYHDEADFDRKNWPEFLRIFFTDDGLGYYCGFAYKALCAIRAQRNLPQDSVIFAPCRTIARSVADATGSAHFNHKRALRTLRALERAGLIKLTVEGQSGTFRRKANGYSMLFPVADPPWEHLERRKPEHNASGTHNVSPARPGPRGPSERAEAGTHNVPGTGH
jgi:hypothetical protein